MALGRSNTCPGVLRLRIRLLCLPVPVPLCAPLCVFLSYCIMPPKQDIDWAISARVDFIAVSFVRTADVITNLRSYIQTRMAAAADPQQDGGGMVFLQTNDNIGSQAGWRPCGLCHEGRGSQPTNQ